LENAGRSASFEGMFVHRRDGPRTSTDQRQPLTPTVRRVASPRAGALRLGHAGVRLGREQLRPLSRARSCRTDQAARAAVERRLELVSPMIEDEERCSARPMISSRRWVREGRRDPREDPFREVGPGA
jgi:hypothetical protein